MSLKSKLVRIGVNWIPHNEIKTIRLGEEACGWFLTKTKYNVFVSTKGTWGSTFIGPTFNTKKEGIRYVNHMLKQLPPN
jgi:hypothetical protein